MVFVLLGLCDGFLGWLKDGGESGKGKLYEGD